MIDSSDRTLLWGGTRIYQLWNKRLEVTTYYLTVLFVVATVAWLPTAFIFDLSKVHGYAITAIPFALAVGAIAALILALASRRLSGWGLNKTYSTSPTLRRAMTITESLCAQVGVEMPELRVLSSPSVNAMSYSLSRHRRVVVLTSAALDELSFVELEVVLAREVARIRSGLSDYDALLGLPRKLLAGLTFGSYPRSLSAALASEVQMVDLAGLTITKFPPALAKALEKVLKNETEHPEVNSWLARATGYQWLDPSVYRNSHEILRLRVDELQEW